MTTVRFYEGIMLSEMQAVTESQRRQSLVTIVTIVLDWGTYPGTALNSKEDQSARYVERWDMRVLLVLVPRAVEESTQFDTIS
jgi:hypothetical protein